MTKKIINSIVIAMPGATEGFINIFDVDTTLMQYDTAQMAADIHVLRFRRKMWNFPMARLRRA